jgi:hypothetical protein
MGQFLAIGIATKFGTTKKELQKQDITKDELIKQLQVENSFEPELYDFSESEQYYLFTLKKEIFETQLIPFLEKFYPMVYPKNSSDYTDVLNKLKNSESGAWDEIADNKYFESYQLDDYAEPDYIYFDKPFNPYAKMFSTSIMLSMEGKIMMEQYGRQFKFFKLCMQKAFPEFLIAKALRVYITG